LYGPGDLRVEEAEIPGPGVEQVLVRMRAVSLCPTDIRKYKGMSDEDQKLLRDLGPIVLGHEGAGVVEEVGPGVRNVRPGDRVVIQPIISCGQCTYCKAGRKNLCENIAAVGAAAGPLSRNIRMMHEQGIGGCYGEYVKVPAQCVIRIPDDVAFDDAVLLEPLADVVHSLDRLQVSEDDTVVIVGLGPMGLLHIEAAASAYGAKTVIGIDPIAARREAALRMGARYVIDPAAEDPVEAVLSLTGGKGANKASVVVGGGRQPRIIEQTLKYMAKEGMVNIFAGTYPPSPMEVDPNWIHYRMLSVVGTVGFKPEHDDKALRFICEGRVHAENVRTPSVTLDELAKGMELYGHPDVLKIRLEI
jgi:L-iditol 2-dehydrogenase